VAYHRDPTGGILRSEEKKLLDNAGLATQAEFIDNDARLNLDIRRCGRILAENSPDPSSDELYTLMCDG